MDTKTFLDLVLPDKGLRCIATPATVGFSQVYPPTNAAAVVVALKLDSQGKNAYFGCASFSEAGSRKGDNVAAVRSYWLDIDCGPDKPYASQGEALLALARMLKAVGLPKPLTISSGRGVHVYWPMSADIAPETWRHVAQGLKLVVATTGLKADPTRTADIASILRPVGVHHRKAEPLKVKLIGEHIAQLDHEQFKLKVFDYLATQRVALPKFSGPRAAVVGTNDDLSGGMEFEPSDPHLVADRCALVGRMRASLGNIPQPAWYSVLGVLVHAEEGEAVAHDWSSGHPQYSEEDTNVKLNQARQFGPTTCVKLGEADLDVCGACRFKGQITTPLMLGRAGFQEPKPVQPAATPKPVMGFAAGDPLLAAPPAAPRRGLPYPYFFNPRLDTVNLLATPDGAPPVTELVCHTMFMPYARMDEGEAGFANWYETVNSKRSFVIPTSAIAGGGRELMTELGKHEIVATAKGKLDAYLNNWLTELKRTTDATALHKHYGWTEDRNFVLGERLVTPEGVRTAVVRGHAKAISSAIEPCGSYDVWRQVVDRAYNHPGQEAFQYMVLLSFAAPLFSLYGEYGGVTAYAHSEGSGAGKTTAQRAGLAAWGNWERLQMSDKAVTTNMLWANMGVMHNLPVLFDELTNQSNDAASELVFAISSGRQKQRMSSDGTPRTNLSDWSTILMASGNNMMSEKLAMHRANSEAELARLFEFTVAMPGVLSPVEAADLFPKLSNNYGHAGLVYADHLVRNRDAVLSQLMSARSKFIALSKATQVERYWTALNGAVLTAAAICNKLDILRFDVAALLRWMIAQMQANRKQTDAAVSKPEEQIGHMLGDLWQGVLVTEGEGDLRANDSAQVIDPRPSRALIGRLLLPRQSRLGQVTGSVVLTPTLLLSVTAVHGWCTKRGVSAREMFQAGVSKGWINPQPRTYSLGKGVKQYAHLGGGQRCWVMDPTRMDAQVAPFATVLSVVGQSSASSSSSASGPSSSGSSAKSP